MERLSIFEHTMMRKAIPMMNKMTLSIIVDNDPLWATGGATTGGGGITGGGGVTGLTTGGTTTAGTIGGGGGIWDI